MADFIIFGSLASSKNDRIWTGKNFILGESGQKYENLFKKQIKRIRPKLVLPFTDFELLWVFEIYHNNKSADASIELLFDLMEANNIVYNDVIIRNYFVLADELDMELPRTNIRVYKFNK